MPAAPEQSDSIRTGRPSRSCTERMRFGKFGGRVGMRLPNTLCGYSYTFSPPATFADGRLSRDSAVIGSSGLGLGPEGMFVSSERLDAPSCCSSAARLAYMAWSYATLKVLRSVSIRREA